MVLEENYRKRQSFSVESLAISSRVTDKQVDREIHDVAETRDKRDYHDEQHSEGPEGKCKMSLEDVHGDQEGEQIVTSLRCSSVDNSEDAILSLSNLTPNSTSTPKWSLKQKLSGSTSSSSPEDSRVDSRAFDVTDESMRSESSNGSHEKHSSVVASSSSACSDMETESLTEEDTHSNRKKARTAFNGDQLRELEKKYKGQKYLTAVDRAQMARTLGLRDQQIKTWFQNRRMKEKRQLRDKEQSQCFSLPTGGVDVAQLAALGICAPSSGQRLGSMSPINYHFQNAVSPALSPAAGYPTVPSSNSSEKLKNSSWYSESNQHSIPFSAPHNVNATAHPREVIQDHRWPGTSWPVYPSVYSSLPFGLFPVLPHLPVIDASGHTPYLGSSAPV